MQLTGKRDTGEAPHGGGGGVVSRELYPQKKAHSASREGERAGGEVWKSRKGEVLESGRQEERKKDDSLFWD